MSELEQSDNGTSSREEIQPEITSLTPLGVAAGVTLAVAGLILSWWFVAAGLLIALIAIVHWARTARSEIAELPSEIS